MRRYFYLYPNKKGFFREAVYEQKLGVDEIKPLYLALSRCEYFMVESK